MPTTKTHPYNETEILQNFIHFFSISFPLYYLSFNVSLFINVIFLVERPLVYFSKKKQTMYTRERERERRRQCRLERTTYEWFIFDLLKLNQKSIIYYFFFRAPFFQRDFYFKKTFLNLFSGLCFISFNPDVIEDFSFFSRNFWRSFNVIDFCHRRIIQCLLKMHLWLCSDLINF